MLSYILHNKLSTMNARHQHRDFRHGGKTKSSVAENLFSSPGAPAYWIMDLETLPTAQQSAVEPFDPVTLMREASAERKKYSQTPDSFHRGAKEV